MSPGPIIPAQTHAKLSKLFEDISRACSDDFPTIRLLIEFLCRGVVSQWYFDIFRMEWHYSAKIEISYTYHFVNILLAVVECNVCDWSFCQIHHYLIIHELMFNRYTLVSLRTIVGILCSANETLKKCTPSRATFHQSRFKQFDDECPKIYKSYMPSWLHSISRGKRGKKKNESQSERWHSSARDQLRTHDRV